MLQKFASYSQSEFANGRAQANGLTVVDTLDSVLLQRAYLPTQQTMQARFFESLRARIEMHDRLFPFLLAGSFAWLAGARSQGRSRYVSLVADSSCCLG